MKDDAIDVTWSHEVQLTSWSIPPFYGRCHFLYWTEYHLMTQHSISEHQIESTGPNGQLVCIAKGMHKNSRHSYLESVGCGTNQTQDYQAQSPILRLAWFTEPFQETYPTL